VTKHLVILGAGTAGTMTANKLHRALPDEWEIEVVEPSGGHVYQPGLLFVPFGGHDPKELVKPIESLLPDDIKLHRGQVDRVDPDSKTVHLLDGTEISYDQLIVATGTSPQPGQTPGLLESGWRETVFDFYTLDGATALSDAMEAFRGGRLVVHVAEMPIKCPVAPLEFAFLADDYFKRRHLRDGVELTYVTPLSGAFTKPTASKKLSGMLEDRGIALESDFYVERVERGALISYDERRIPFDLLVTVPVNMGAEWVGRSGLGDELNYVRVDRRTLLADGHDDIFAIGDAAAIPTSKAGSTAHFAVDVFVENFLDHIAGLPMVRSFDGHANCFVECGDGKALLLDFNYDVEPLSGVYPIPALGPLQLLKESRMNHWAKRAFEPIYWHVLLPGRRLPVPVAMSMAGKRRPQSEEQTT
jgi:sulfide:quinone oxidoreductase